MRERKRKTFPVLLTTFFLMSCFKKEVAPQQMKYFHYPGEGRCNLDLKRFRFVFARPMEEDIDCLSNNLKEFIKVVRRKDSGFVEHEDLNIFLKRFYPAVASAINPVSEPVYWIISFLLGESQGKVSVEKADTFFRMLHLFNRLIPSIVELFYRENRADYWVQRSLLEKALEEFKVEFKSIISSSPEETVQIDIASLVEKFGDFAKAKREDRDFFLSFGVAKVLVLGGTPTHLSHGELMNFVDKLPGVMLLVSDFIHISGKDFTDSAERELFFYNMFKKIPSYLHDLPEERVIASSGEVVLILGKFFPFLADRLAPIERAVLLLKPQFSGREQEADGWSYGDIADLLQWIKRIFGIRYFNDVAINGQRSANNLAVKGASTEMDGFRHQFEEVDDKYGPLKDIYSDEGELLDKWEFIKGFLANGVHGQKNGKTIKYYNEVVLMRLFVAKIVESYAPENEGLAVENLEKFLTDIKPLLMALGIELTISPSLAQSILHSMDLFQFHSDGDGLASVDEITGYLISLYHIDRLASLAYHDLQKVCKDEDEQCYRDQFLENFFARAYYPRYFDLLFEEETQLAKEFVRDIGERASFSNKKGIFKFMMALFSIEGIFIRFDQNKNGRIAGPELERAYKVFKRVIWRFGEDRWPTLDRERWVRSYFFYIVKYKEIPGNFWLSIFHNLVSKMNLSVTREDLILIINGMVDRFRLWEERNLPRPSMNHP